MVRKWLIQEWVEEHFTNLIQDKWTLFVCDDDGNARGLIRGFLDKRGYCVREMESGIDLLSALTNERPAAILLALFMPDMNGWECVARIKSDPSTADIPLIVVSVLSAEETGISLDEVSAWVQKPFNDEALAAAIDRVL